MVLTQDTLGGASRTVGSRSRWGRSVAIAGAAIGASLALAGQARAAIVTVTADSSKYSGYMNVFNLPADGGGYVFGSGWGIADLRSQFDATSIALKANAIGDPSTFWYQGGGAPGNAGNKTMDASLYIQDDTLANDTVTFSGVVLSNTLVSPYTSVAFIKQFDGAYNLIGSQTVPLTPGAFSVTLSTATAATDTHVQYGFQTIGPNAWITDADGKGSVVIAAIPAPEPTSIAAIAAVTGLGVARRRRG